jgi:hypothetical protein
MYSRIKENPQIIGMLHDVFLSKFNKIEILDDEIDSIGNMKVEISVNNILIEAVMNCKLSADKKNLNIININFVLKSNIQDIINLISLFDKNTSLEIDNGLKKSFQLFNSTVRLINIQFNKNHHIQRVIIDGNYTKIKENNSKWSMTIFPHEDNPYSITDLEDIFVINYLYMISEIAMENLLGFKLYEFDNNYVVLENYRKLNIVDIVKIIEMTVI